jgi:hypothetical protein
MTNVRSTPIIAIAVTFAAIGHNSLQSSFIRPCPSSLSGFLAKRALHRKNES